MNQSIMTSHCTPEIIANTENTKDSKFWWPCKEQGSTEHFS